MLYAAAVPSEAGLDALGRFLRRSPNRLLELVPDAAKWQDVLRVMDCRDALPPEEQVYLAADSREQIMVRYRAKRP